MSANLNLNSVETFQQMKVEIQKIQEALENLDVDSMHLILMEEKEVLELFKVSRSTLYNYRSKYKLKAYNLFGRNYFFKHEIYEVLINQLLK